MKGKITAAAVAILAFATTFPAFASGDDVIVDGRIITGENYNSAPAAGGDPGFIGGVFVAAGDSAAKGKAPGFSAYDQSYQGGVRVAVGDVNGDASGGGAHHSGGVNVVFGDGSVRNTGSPVGGNETIAIGSGRTEAPKGAGLGSLQGLGSIGQLSAPKGTGEAANHHVRHRGFAIVDRTQATGEDKGGGAGSHAKVFDGRTGGAATQGGGPTVKGFSGSGSSSGNAVSVGGVATTFTLDQRGKSTK